MNIEQSVQCVKNNVFKIQVNYSYRVRAEVLCNIQLQRLKPTVNLHQQQTLELKLVNLRPPRILSDKKVLFDFLHRFPHDTQHCYISLESWTFTDEDMRFSKIILFSTSRPKPKFQAQLGISCERSFWDEPFQDGQLSL